ncbi:carnitine O-acetyltransferase-like [Schistocerca gregaria]|uniref:carnitine O-acetyltransferase-like n=1 Tax=Schistocerca gregaria TaxID=7010 RepID=UPI00211EEFBD|nr:carnitine O-acetyltransferase-like [Schistocerca gregaria]XP_049831481.1 carnitine O-acetyltransferase-like [Schistocerca gregaria]XP_049831482.1 carnitine O-acetyltransferase-like [Schistocerca gregaria]XP_049831483.1 carnitine O-acetyltransferase-like [Schistocerca gregaria]
MLKILQNMNAMNNMAMRISDNMLHQKKYGFLSFPLQHHHHHIRRNLVSAPAALPHLPVPALQQTMEKYLRSVKPLITAEEYSVTEDLVKNFVAKGGIGEKLQNLLLQKAKSTENWLADWWLHASYLDYRWPVVVYSSPGLVFPLQTFHSIEDQLKMAAKVIAGALEYKVLLDENKLPQETMGKDPLDMSQYHKILGTCRIPGVTRDSLWFADPANPPKHIIVTRNNHFFYVEVFGANYEPLSEDQILQQLQKVVEGSQYPSTPLGILTTENRNTWGKAYKKLAKDKSNSYALDSIKTSLFLMCLDKPNPNLKGLNKSTVNALQMVHGLGSKVNGANRWYDKTVQFVVGPDGELGLTYEHSPAEGPPIANLMDHIMDYISKGATRSTLPAVNYVPPQRLKFNISDDIKTVIETAETNLDILVNDLEMACFKFPNFGKDFIKSQKLSPDSFIQMAIQLAYYRLHNQPGAHYESASTRKFIHGRTETIRSCSIESVEFAKTMLDSSKSDKEKAAALQKAIKSHKDYTIQAVNGLGVDRHLLGLKMIAIENGLDVPKLFLDSGYICSTHMKLSTSQVAARCEAFMCYAPLVPDGYGCCYNPRDKEIFFGTSAFNSSPETSAQKFKEALERSLIDMQNVLLASQLKSKL